LIRLLRDDRRVTDIALTTNGLLLAKNAEELKAAGLDRVTISLDTLHPQRMEAFAKSDRHQSVLQGIDAARRAGFQRIKVNAVVIRGFNDDEVTDLIAFGQARGLEVRFIEYMDVGGATRWSLEQVVSRDQILAQVAARFGAATPDPDSVNPSAPAERYRLPDGTPFGIIASTTAPFCGSCDRSRLTADGTWFLCLYADRGLDLREALRGGAGDAELTALVRDAWTGRMDRGAEDRLHLEHRTPLVPTATLRADPHREMHTRGG
ncbi:MAG TPA: radical SAM protein, partial [Gemmatimonadales bacterium]|nr:radical SAM protein [Gemmatimonadales bacterium]